MKKLALLNIKEPTPADINLDKKTTSERAFLDRHPEMLEKDDADENEEYDNQDKEESKETNEEYRIVIEEYTVQEEKIWDCYQMFCKLINYKYNPYDDHEIEEYLAMQELQDEEEAQFIHDKENAGMLKSVWPFGQ